MLSVLGDIGPFGNWIGRQVDRRVLVDKRLSLYRHCVAR